MKRCLSLLMALCLLLTGCSVRGRTYVPHGGGLARERAETVADMLVNKFGIERDRMEVSSMQGDEQPFQINDWNRVVIITVD